MIIKQVKPISCAKIFGTLYAVMGLLLGAGISAISLLGGFNSGAPAPPGFGRMMGASAIVLFPILYGCLGFVGTLIGAALYNLAAGVVGGIEFETQ